MKKYLFLLIAIIVVSASLSAQDRNPFITIDNLIDSIQSVMREEKMSGLMLGITKKDSILYSGGFGYADIENKRRVDSTTRFRLGSITKMFVSLGILKLVNEGRLNLNDELKKVAPEVPFKNKWETNHPVRIINLLEHTSGFDDMQLNRMYNGDTIENKGIGMMLVHKNSMICRWKPGERFAYSNPNYTILGYVIEKLTGESFDSYLTKNILAPLGMKNSDFSLRSKFPGTDVKEYIIDRDIPVQVKSVTCLSAAPGALWSDAADMIKFIQLFLRNGSPLFPESTIDIMEMPQSSLAAKNGQRNGYALANDNTSFVYMMYPFHGHNGLTGTCYSALKYNRDLGIGFIISNNSNKRTDRIEALIASFFEQDLAEKKLIGQQLQPDSIINFTGRYVFKSPRNAISAFKDELQNAPSIIFEKGKLWFKPLFGTAHEIIQTGNNEFAFSGDSRPLIKFLVNDEGKRVLMIAGSYFEKTSNFWAMAKRIGLVSAFLIMISSVFLLLVSIILAAIKKITWSAVAGRFVPVVGFVALVFAVGLMVHVQTNSYLLYKFGTKNELTLTVFIGTLIFALATIFTIYSAIRNFGRTKSRTFAVYYLLIAFSMFAILTLLLANGWIGLRLWAL